LPGPAFTLSFVRTPDDVVTAFSEARTVGTGMRPWIRAASVVIQYVVLLLLVLTKRDEAPPWGMVAMAAAAALIAWSSVIRPVATVRAIRREAAAAQPVTISFDDAGIQVTDGRTHYERSWDDLARAHSASPGVLLAFRDGTKEWLPVRAFKSHSERRAVLDYITDNLGLAAGM